MGCGLVFGFGSFLWWLFIGDLLVGHSCAWWWIVVWFFIGVLIEVAVRTGCGDAIGEAVETSLSTISVLDGLSSMTDASGGGGCSSGCGGGCGGGGD